MTTRGIYNRLAKPALILILAVFVFLPVVATAQNSTTTPQEENNEQNQTNNDSSSGNQGGTTGKNCPQNECPGDTKPNSPISIEKDLDQGYAATFLYRTFMSIGGFFAWFGGMALDTTISYLVIGMGEFVQGSMLTVINELWTIVRDIFNILFIFGLIYIGFKTILGTDETGTRRMLVTLIAAALLINFSLLFTKTIVDFSNAAAYQLYELVGGADSTYQIIAGGGATRGIAASFLQTTDITSFANPKDKAETKKMGDWNFIVYGFFGMILMVIAAFVFLAGAFMLIARFIILIFSMIFSPAMFLGWIFPQFNNLSSMWWSKFLGNAFMAPAYIFMLFLTLKLIQTIRTSGSIFEALQGDSYTLEAFSIMIVFFVMIGFLYGSLLVSQKMGAAGASQAISIGDNLRKRVQSYAGAQTVGRAAHWVGRGYDYMEASKKNQSKGTRFLRGTARTFANIATLGATSDKVVRDTLTTGEQAKFGGPNSFESYKKADQERTVTLSRRAELQTLIKAFKEGGDVAAKAASGASTAQMVDIAKNQGKLLLNNAGAITSGQLTKIMDEANIDDGYKKALGKKVSKVTSEKFAKKDSDGNVKKTPKGDIEYDSKEVPKISKAQIKAIGAEQFINNPTLTVNVNTDQIKHIESEFTEGETVRFKNNRERNLLDIVEKGSAHGKNKDDLLNMKPSELPKKVLLGLAGDLSAGSLEKIAKDNKFDPGFSKELRKEILEKPGAVEEPPRGRVVKDYTEANHRWEFLYQDRIGKFFGTS